MCRSTVRRTGLQLESTVEDATILFTSLLSSPNLVPAAVEAAMATPTAARTPEVAATGQEEEDVGSADGCGVGGVRNNGHVDSASGSSFGVAGSSAKTSNDGSNNVPGPNSLDVNGGSGIRAPPRAAAPTPAHSPAAAAPRVSTATTAATAVAAATTPPTAAKPSAAASELELAAVTTAGLDWLAAVFRLGLACQKAAGQQPGEGEVAAALSAAPNATISALSVFFSSPTLSPSPSGGGGYGDEAKAGRCKDNAISARTVRRASATARWLGCRLSALFVGATDRDGNGSGGGVTVGGNGGSGLEGSARVEADESGGGGRRSWAALRRDCALQVQKQYW